MTTEHVVKPKLGSAFKLALAFAFIVNVSTARGEYVFQTLHEFFLTNGGPQAPIGLSEGSDGNFYGTTSGGSNNTGTIYKLTPAGAVTVLYSFAAFPATNGNYPVGGLIQSYDGLFYGVANSGGEGRRRNGIQGLDQRCTSESN
jgi:uncharacterized repeat protein (TIGR03803 family)